MTARADLLRDERRVYAAPGSSHDRLVHLLNGVLPMGVGVVLAVMIISPLFPASEVSFLLDRNKVAITNERLRINDASYRGQDKQGRMFELTAGNAVQQTARVPEVRMENLLGRLQLSDGPATVAARAGRYRMDSDQVLIDGDVDFKASDGYAMTTRGVTIDLKTHRATGSGGVAGQVPSGTFRADRLEADLDNRTVTLQGRARLRMVPGQFRMPK